MGVAEDPEFRGCLEDEETSGHVLMTCPVFSYARMRILGQPMLLPRDLCPSNLVAFIKDTGCCSSLTGGT